jgi:serine kinase of HPr protein (carbohydrate metabolism regulator)
VSETIHAGLIALWVGNEWRGALIEGPSGAGKSDLALRALDAGWRLVADDRVLLWRSGGRLYGRAPAALSGLIEARGLDVLRVAPLRLSRIDLVVACAPSADAVERLPDPATAARQGVTISTLKLWPFEPAAIAKLSRGIRHLGAGR